MAMAMGMGGPARRGWVGARAAGLRARALRTGAGPGPRAGAQRSRRRWRASGVGARVAVGGIEGTVMSEELSQRVYDHLCQCLLDGRLSGSDRVSELVVAKQTGVSRSPVREALVRLRAEGLLQHVPKLGSFVRSPSRSDLEDLYAVRQWLEAGAAGAVALARDEESLTTLQRLNDETLAIAREFYRSGQQRLPAEQAARVGAIDTEFHLTLASATSNDFGSRLIARAHMMIAVGRYRVGAYGAEHVSRMYTDHDLVLRSIRRGDALEASRVMGEHIRWSASAVREQFDARQSAPASRGSRADWPEPMRRVIENAGPHHHAAAPQAPAGGTPAGPAHKPA
ncbi:MAG: hypothetical protein C0475_06660 [Planctomyces sp.]|nr:hypothetical protein [Planctomyces sp.]